MRGRLPYVLLLFASVAALAGSAAWAATWGDGRHWRARGSLGPGGICSVPPLDGTVVGVRLVGMQGEGMMGGSVMGGGMMQLVLTRSTVPAGRVSFVAQNMGGDVHELVVLPLAAGQSVGRRTVGADDQVSETGSVGEASRSCGAGAGEGVKPGSAGWVTLDLKPGRYELVCNLPGHYRSGMVAGLDVE